jgi:DNA-directed RNA polymerase alpha subunit
MKKKLPEISQKAKLALTQAALRKDPVSNLEELGIGQRMINLFHDNEIHHMEDLLTRKQQELLALSNFGETQLHKLFYALSNYHLLEE